MRRTMVLLGLAGLAACKGGGPETVGSNAAPAGAGVGATGTSTHSFVNPTVAKTYAAVGGTQGYEYSTDGRNCCGQQGQTFAGNASTVRNSQISVTYDPRDAIFTLKVSDPLANATTETRFQDPASRTNFGGAREPQWGAPQLANSNIRYLQAGDGNPLSVYSHSGSGAVNAGDNATPASGASGSSLQSSTFFYEVPGTRTKYVTFAGYVRNSYSFVDVTIGSGASAVTIPQTQWHLERGAFAYGEQTNSSAVPKLGAASYTGGMLATMVYNPTLDGAYGGELPSYFQWIEGTSRVNVDFAASTVGVTLDGTVKPGQFDYYTPDASHVTIIPGGASFTAAGAARIDLVNAGGFTGQIQSASFGAALNGAPTAVAIAGSSIDGAFFGPAAEEVGGGFRIVGGTPDQRIDILGTFTGGKP